MVSESMPPHFCGGSLRRESYAAFVVMQSELVGLAVADPLTNKSLQCVTIDSIKRP
jgi:hypothetical protein